MGDVSSESWSLVWPIHREGCWRGSQADFPVALSAGVRSRDLIPGQQAVNLSDVGVEVNRETGTVRSQREDREGGAHSHRPPDPSLTVVKGLEVLGHHPPPPLPLQAHHPHADDVC